MVKKYLIGIFTSLVLIGCSSTYRISDFSSEEKFYEDFNNFTKDKNVKVTLSNDSVFYSNNGTEIIRDTLYTLKNSIVQKRLAPIDKVKTVSYKKNWLGIPPGFLLGSVSGLLVGAVGLIPVYESRDEPDGQQIRDHDIGGGIVYGTVIGIIIGSVAGWFVGHNYVYQFNP